MPGRFTTAALIGLLAQPESLFTTAAQALDYQFGFNVSETWFFQLLQKNIAVLLLAQFAVLLLSTCVVFVDAGEQAVLEHFGKPVGILTPGAHLKLPWPVDKIYRYRTDQIQTLDVGYTPDAQSENENTILWSVAHTKEDNFLVGNRAPAMIQNDNDDDDTNDTLKAPPVSLITVSIPVQFQITNVLDWAYQNADPTNLLQDLATRAVVHYLAGVDLNDVMSHARLEAAQELQEQIQAAADERKLGAKILFVGLQDIHPPVDRSRAITKKSSARSRRNSPGSSPRRPTPSARMRWPTRSRSRRRMSPTRRAQQLEVSAYARAALFTNQIPAFEAAPSVYRQRAYFQAFADATANSRKYVLLVTNTQDVLIFDLEDKIRKDLLNVNVPNE